MTEMSISTISPALGAEVLGVDLGRDLGNPDTVARIRAAFLEHHVLVFREQELSRDQHKAFGRLFGTLHVHPSRRGPGIEGDPEIFVVKTDTSTKHNNGGRWHTDVSCDERPPLGSMLLLTEAPPEGGDTLFANMHLALEVLSEPVRRMLSELSAFHDGLQDLRWYGYQPRPGTTYPAHAHPLVVAHPDTGRPLLFANEAFTSHIEGLSQHESESILRMLFTGISGNPAIQCRVKWAPGTLTFWDNRCTQHYAVWDYAPHPRRGERVSISSDTPPHAFGSR